MTESFHSRLNRWVVTLDDGRRTYRYRHVMEEHLGRRLKRSEYIHHLNGDSTDDRLENLVVVSGKQHAEYHSAERMAWARKDWQHEWSRDHACCVECGTTERKHAGHGQCTRCYFRNRSRRDTGGGPRKPAIIVTKRCPQCDEVFTRRGADRQTIYCSRPCAAKAVPAKAWATRRANGTDRGWGKAAA